MATEDHEETGGPTTSALREAGACTCGQSLTGLADELRRGLAGASVAVTLADENLEVVWANQASSDYVGAPIETAAEEMIGPKGGREWAFFDASGRRYDLIESMRQSLASRTPMPPRVVGARRPDGALTWSEMEVIPVPACHCGATWHLATVFTDLTEQRFAEQVLRRLAFSDPLTGLANRAVLEDRLDQARLRARRNETPTSVYYFDFDGFKAINDEHGHEAGDKVLKIVAGRLTAALRPEDTVARVGGDEFVAVVEGMGGIEDATGRLRAAIERQATIRVDGVDHEVDVRVSIGRIVSTEAMTSTELIRLADEAMYDDKRRRDPRARRPV